MNSEQGLDRNLVLAEELKSNDGKKRFIISKQDIVGGYKSKTDAFRIATFIIAGVACAISLIIIFIVTSLLIEENKANISVLKVKHIQLTTV